MLEADDQGRGYGYWTGCEQVSAFARGRVGVTISRPVIDTLEPSRVGVSLNRAALGAFARGENQSNQRSNPAAAPMVAGGRWRRGRRRPLNSAPEILKDVIKPRISCRGFFTRRERSYR
jgi:hypothetical protein